MRTERLKKRTTFFKVFFLEFRFTSISELKIVVPKSRLFRNLYTYYPINAK
jgi:hypothetical protein